MTKKELSGWQQFLANLGIVIVSTAAVLTVVVIILGLAWLIAVLVRLIF